MRKAWLYPAVLLVSSTCAWSLGWGLLRFPSYDNSSKEALSKFDENRNGSLEYVFDMQTGEPSSMGQSSKFGSLLVAWDAKADWQTSRGTLQTIWSRAGEPAPAEGWPSVQKPLTLEDLNLMWPNLPD